MNKFRALAIAGISAVMLLTGACAAPAETVSQNISNDADNFKVDRRIVIVNLIANKPILEVTGKCSITNNVASKQFEVTCKIGPDAYIKDYLVYTDGANVITTIEQLKTSNIGSYQYKLNFFPSELIPTIVTG